VKRRAFGWTLLGGTLWARQAPKGPVRLSVARVVFHQGEDGAALPATYQYVSGEPLYLSFRIAGYRAVKDQVELRWQIIATDPDGLLLFPPLSGELREEVTHNDENWLPRVQQTLTLPPQLPSGVFKLKLRVADQHAQASAEHEAEFRVRGRQFAPQGELTVRNLRFFREEDDPYPAEPPLFTAGATIWLRFDILGFQLGDKNLYDVGYGVQVLRPSGKVLFETEDAAREKETPFYPKRAMLGGFSLNTTPDLTPGEYTVVIRVRDAVGGHEVEHRGVFQVEKPPG
jgi:hypothetical protein